jgi:predicted peroxiredoxin
LAKETSPYVLWYKFVVIKYIFKKENNEKLLELDNPIIEEWYEQIRQNGLELVVCCLRKVYCLDRNSYIIETVMEDLLTLLH